MLGRKAEFELADVAAAVAGRHFLESEQFPRGLRNFRNNYELTREFEVAVTSEHYEKV